MKNFIKKNFNIIVTVIATLILSFSIVVVSISTSRIGIKKEEQPDWETLYNEQNYGEVIDLKRTFSEDEIFDKTQSEKYYVYFYSPTCSHCSEIRETITSYAVAENCKVLYFVDTSKNAIPGPSSPDSSLIKKSSESGEDRFLVDLNGDGLYSKKFSDGFYVIHDTETDTDVLDGDKRVVFLTEAEATKYITDNLDNLEKYQAKHEDFEEKTFYGYETEWFNSTENAENAIRFKEVRSIVGKDKFEDIKIFGTPSLIEISPSFIKPEGEENSEGGESTEGEETSEEVSNHFELTNIFIGSTEIRNKMEVLTEKLSYYSITYNLDEGHFKADEEIPYEYKTGEGLATLPIAYKDGVRFDHWETFSDEDSTSLKEISSIPAEAKKNFDLFVAWTDTAKITFDLNGGYRDGHEGESEFYNTDYKIGSTYSVANLPSGIAKEGCSFVGWTLSLNGDDLVTEDFVLPEYITLHAKFADK